MFDNIVSNFTLMMFFMKAYVQRIAFLVVTVFVAASFVGTVGVELFGSVKSLKLLKMLVIYPGFLLFVPAVAVMAVCSFNTSDGEGRTACLDVRRNRFISINAVFVLIPVAILLNKHAKTGSLDSYFYFLQLLELFSLAFSFGLALMNLRNIELGSRKTTHLSHLSLIHI